MVKYILVDIEAGTQAKVPAVQRCRNEAAACCLVPAQLAAARNPGPAMKPQRHLGAPSGTKTRISLRVQPNASKDRVVGETESGWKIALTAPPVDGKANKACLAFLAKLLHVPRASIHIVRGATSRQKVIEVIGLSLTEVEDRFRTQSAIQNPENK